MHVCISGLHGCACLCACMCGRIVVVYVSCVCLIVGMFARSVRVRVCVRVM